MELWTENHLKYFLPAVIVELIFTIVLSILLRNKSIKFRMIPFQIISLSLFILEIVKQLIYILRPEGYSYSVLPFNFCSIFVFILPIYSFTGLRKVTKFSSMIRSFSNTALLMVFVSIMVSPSTVIHGRITSFLTFHNVYFHLALVLLFFLVIGLNMYDTSLKKDMKYAFVGCTIYGIIGGSAANIFKINYLSYYRGLFKPLETMRLFLHEIFGSSFGQASYTIIMIIFISLLGLIASIAFFYLTKLKDRLIKRK